MKRDWIGTVAYFVLLCCVTASLAYGQSSNDKVKIKGLITGRTGDTLIVKTSGGDVVVGLADDTKVQKPKGLGLRRTQMSAAVLIPGLKIEVNGVGDAQTKVVAQAIDFSQDDLEMAEAIQAGLIPTQQAVKVNQQNTQANREKIRTNALGVSANKQQIEASQKQIDANQQQIEETTKRFSALTDFDIKGSTVVNFALGSSIIPTQGQTALKALAYEAANLKGYIIQVEGFADSSGSAAMNQQLSMARADAVVAYLIQNCNIPVRHIVAPGAMGESNPSGPNETAQGRAENRRVEVKVLLNKGLAGN